MAPDKCLKLLLKLVDCKVSYSKKVDLLHKASDAEVKCLIHVIDCSKFYEQNSVVRKCRMVIQGIDSRWFHPSTVRNVISANYRIFRALIPYYLEWKIAEELNNYMYHNCTFG